MASGKKQKTEKVSKKQSITKDTPQVPSIQAPQELLQAVEGFLASYGLKEEALRFRKSAGLKSSGTGPATSLIDIFNKSQAVAAKAAEDNQSESSASDETDSDSDSDSEHEDVGTEAQTAPIVDDASDVKNIAKMKTISTNVESSSESSESEEDDSDSDSDSESSSGSEIAEEAAGKAQEQQPVAEPKPTPVKNLKRKASVSSDSGSSSSSESDSDDEPKLPAKRADPPSKKLKIAQQSSVPASAPSATISDDSSSSESESSESSSDSESDSEAEAKAEVKSSKSTITSQPSEAITTAQDATSDESSDSSSEEESNDDSSSSESSADAPAPVKPLPSSGLIKARKDSNSDSSQTARVSPEFNSAVSSAKKRKADAAELESPDGGSPYAAAIAAAEKRQKSGEERFRRVPLDTKVDPRFSSNKYQSYDYADRAHQDLIVTKGKGFTKEKNKKKRGSYRGGAIDTVGVKGIRFDD